MDYTVPTENIRALIVRKNESKNLTAKCCKRKRFPNSTAGYPKIQNKQTIREKQRCLLPKPKSPTPNTKDLIEKFVVQQKHEKNYIEENIYSVKNMTCKEKPHIIQDSYDGHCQNLNQAGLELKYVFKKEYGKIPRYIQKNRCLMEKIEKNKQQAGNEQPEQSMRYVHEEEKDAVLNGLKNNLKEVERKFLSLPIVTDTISKQNRKIYLENLLFKLQQDIETLERHDIIIVND